MPSLKTFWLALGCTGTEKNKMQLKYYQMFICITLQNLQNHVAEFSKVGKYCSAFNVRESSDEQVDKLLFVFLCEHTIAASMFSKKCRGDTVAAYKWRGWFQLPEIDVFACLMKENIVGQMAGEQCQACKQTTEISKREKVSNQKTIDS